MNLDGSEELPYYTGFLSAIEVPVNEVDDAANWAIDESSERSQAILGAAGIDLWSVHLSPPNEAPANNHVGNDYLERMGMLAFDWPSEIGLAAGDDLPALRREPEPDVVVTGPRSYWYIYVESPAPPVPSTDPTIEPLDDGRAVVIELIDACPVEQSASERSLDLLYNNSATARALIDAMAANGTMLNLITAHLSGVGAQARFDPPPIKYCGARSGRLGALIRTAQLTPWLQ